MKQLIFGAICLIFCLSVKAQDVIIDNQTTCNYIIDLTEAPCKFDITGPLDAPSNTTQTYDLASTAGIGGGASSVEGIRITDSDSGNSEDILFGTCGSDTSPHTLNTTSMSCASVSVDVEWQVVGSNFEIVIL